MNSAVSKITVFDPRIIVPNITISVPLSKVNPVANFSINVTKGCSLSVKFTDMSKNATKISQDFENDGVADILSDGLVISTEIDPNIVDDNPETPVYVYTAPGNYTVNLTERKEYGTNFTVAKITVKRGWNYILT